MGENDAQISALRRGEMTNGRRHAERREPEGRVPALEERDGRVDLRLGRALRPERLVREQVGKTHVQQIVARAQRAD